MADLCTNTSAKSSSRVIVLAISHSAGLPARTPAGVHGEVRFGRVATSTGCQGAVSFHDYVLSSPTVKSVAQWWSQAITHDDLLHCVRSVNGSDSELDALAWLS
jgi:hypothetical protein